VSWKRVINRNLKVVINQRMNPRKHKITMKQFTSDEIQNQFEKLPKDLQDAISSPEVHDSIVAIGNKYGLHVDQLGEMVDLVGLVMLGLSPSNDFIKDFAQQAEVKNDIASSIANDINKEIFGKIRSSMQSIEAKNQAIETEQTKSQQSISDLERIGGFSIEPNAVQNENGVAPANLPGAEEVTESKDDLMAGIEDPKENHTDIIVDNLLAGPVASIEKKTEKPLGPDSYREPIE
jgi:hypothetical protein